MTLRFDYIARIVSLLVSLGLTTHGFIITLGEWRRGVVSNFYMTLVVWVLVPLVICSGTVIIITAYQLLGRQLTLRRWVIYGLNPVTSFMANEGMLIWGEAVCSRRQEFQLVFLPLLVLIYIAAIFFPRGVIYQNVLTYCISMLVILMVLIDMLY